MNKELILYMLKQAQDHVSHLVDGAEDYLVEFHGDKLTEIIEHVTKALEHIT